MEEILVKKGKTVVSDRKGTRLTAQSVGSALAITAIDLSAGVSGMAVCMIPRKSDGAPGIPDVLEQIRELFKKMITMGAHPQNMLLFLTGAAGFVEEPDEMAIGKRLYRMVMKTIKKNGLQITAEHVGGPFNRTVSVKVGDKNLTVTMPDEREVII